MTTVAKRVELGIKDIIIEYDENISEQVKNLAKYIGGCQYILQKDLYLCNMDDQKMLVVEIYKTLVKGIIKILYAPDVELGYKQIGYLIAALDDLDHLKVMTRKVNYGKVIFCMESYKKIEASSYENKRKWFETLGLLDQ